MVDILAIGAHPDDCEIFMGGTILAMAAQGRKVAVCDLTMGEAGTYGSADLRKKELDAASEILKLESRHTLNMPDGNVRNSEKNRMKVIEVIRKLRPELIFTFSSELIRHPDHKYCGEIVREAAFLSGLERVITGSPAFRPSGVITFPELIVTEKPSFVIDISEFRGAKLDSIRCYSSQVIKPGEDDAGTKTLIRSNMMWNLLEARDVTAGGMIGVDYGEPFYSPSVPAVKDPIENFRRSMR